MTARGALPPIERGQCLRHGYVTSRCCRLFEPTKASPFLRPALEKAVADAMQGVRDQLEGMMTEKTFVVAAFSLRPECRKCGYDRFRWEYRERVGQGEPMEELGGGPRYPHLHLVCDRCSAAFDMETRDREGAK